MPNIDERDISWLAIFLEIQNENMELLWTLTKENADKLPPNLDVILNTGEVLRPVLVRVNQLPKPKPKILQDVKKSYERMIDRCIKADDMAQKMADDVRTNSNLAARMHFATVVGFIGQARVFKVEYDFLLGKALQIFQMSK